MIHVTTVPETLAFLTGQIRHLKDRGFAMWAVSSPGPGLASFARQEDIPACAVEMARRITPLADLVSIFRLWRVFRRLRPDLVHGHTPKGGLLSMIGAFLAGVPVRIYTVHGLPLETARGMKRVLLRWTERLSCLLAHRVHSVSASLSQRVLSEALCPPSKLALLGRGTINGVDATRYFEPGPGLCREADEVRRRLSIPSEARVIGFVGRVGRDKGVEELVEAWTGLKDEFPDLRLLVVGSMESRDPISPETEGKLRTDPRIHLAGRVESMPALYQVMDVVALPTYREGFPQVPLEAAAMERPVVATRVTGCVDAIADGITGTLVPARNPEALAGALRAYLKEPGLRLGHGRAGRSRVLRDFRPEASWDAMEKEYHQRLGLRAALRGTPPPNRGVPAPRRGSPRPLEHLVKRILDLAIAILVLVLAFPVGALTALAIYLTLGRPVFFRQTRPGLKGKPFSLIKFRTMRPGNAPDDERMTELGRFLRRTSLDELPQLWNVFRGEMSLVGPRPLLMDYLGIYTPRQARRHEVKPGITGWVQVNGRNSLDWDHKFELDHWYVEHWSLLLDLKILLMTMGRVMGRSGIDGPGNQRMTRVLGKVPGDGTGVNPISIAGGGR